jgi:hypothetical protein
LIKKSDEQADLGEGIAELFSKELYRLNFIAMTEVPQAFWFGYASAARIMGTQLEIIAENDPCENCINPETFIHTGTARTRLRRVPALHPNCECTLQVLS